MNKLIKSQPMAPNAIAMIRRVLSPTQCLILHLGDVDTRFEGVLESTTDFNGKCLWLKDGRRVELSFNGGVIAGTLSNETDPEYPGREEPPNPSSMKAVIDRKRRGL